MTASALSRYLASILIFLLTLEGLARLDDYVRDGADLVAPYDIDNLFQTGVTSRVGRPGARYAKWQMNQSGYRGPEPQAGQDIVLVYGASEAFGLYESPGTEVPRQLEAQLNQRLNPAVSVVNIALPGLRVGRMPYLDQAMTRLRPTHVVIYPTPAAYIGLAKGYCHAPPETIGQPAPRHMTWRLSGKLELLFKKQAPGWLMTALRRLDVWRAARNMVVSQQVPDATIKAFAEDVDCAIEHIRQQGAKPILLTHATRFGATPGPGDEDMLLAWRRSYPDLAEEGFLDMERRANLALIELASRQGVRLVRADQVLPPGPIYFADFVHFTDTGALTLAKALAADWPDSAQASKVKP
jgi:hypothetical protein